MKCRNCNRFLGFGHYVEERFAIRSQSRPATYTCPRCGHREAFRPERRKRDIPVAFDRRAVAV